MINVVPTELKRPVNVSIEAWASIVTQAARVAAERATSEIDHRIVVPNGMPFEQGRAVRFDERTYYGMRKSHRGPASRSALERRVLTSVVSQITGAKQEVIAKAMGVRPTTVSTNLSMHHGKCFNGVFDVAVRSAKAATIKAILDPGMHPA
jgi:hypothetical protein